MGAKIETPKISIRLPTKPKEILGPKINPPKILCQISKCYKIPESTKLFNTENKVFKSKFGCTLFEELCGLHMQALPPIFRLFWNIVKKISRVYPLGRTPRSFSDTSSAWNFWNPSSPSFHGKPVVALPTVGCSLRVMLCFYLCLKLMPFVVPKESLPCKLKL